MINSTQRFGGRMETFLSAGLKAFVAAFGVIALSGSLHAAAIVPGFDSNSIPRQDDGNSVAANVGFNLNYYGRNTSTVYVSNNGYINFDNSIWYCCSTELESMPVAMIAPFFVDLDTRYAHTTPVSFGQGTYEGHQAFGANWVNIARCCSGGAVDSFQLILVDRSDTGAGNFDVIFNYDQIAFDTGAQVGFGDGMGWAYTLPGSGYDNWEGDYYYRKTDGGPNAMVNSSINSPVLGRYVFEVRDGEVQPIPEPSTLSMLGFGVFALGFGAWKRRFKK